MTPKTAAGAGAPFTFIVDRYAAVSDAAAIDSAKKGRPVTLPVTLVGTLDRFESRGGWCREPPLKSNSISTVRCVP